MAKAGRVPRVEKDGQGSKDQSRVNTFPQFRNSVVRTKTLSLSSSREGNNWGLHRCKTCEVFLCFVAIVWVRVYHVYYVDFFVLFVLSHCSLRRRQTKPPV